MKDINVLIAALFKFAVYLAFGILFTYLAYGDVSLSALGTWVHILFWLPLMLWWGLKATVLLIFGMVLFLTVVRMIAKSNLAVRFVAWKMQRKRDRTLRRANKILRQAGYKYEYKSEVHTKDEV